MNAIEITNLTKNYGKFTAVNNISLKVKQGEIVGFVGKNGAGKTTTIRCMLDILKPTKGKIFINGLDASNKSDTIKTFLGYMPSDTSFYETIRCIDIFKLSCDVSKTSREKIFSLCNYFELDPHKKFKDLSLGNKKKVSIIQSLLKDPNILILDEPTSGLDPLMQKKFFDLLLDLKKQNKTVFLSSHNLADIQKYCDRVLIIKDGVIVEDMNMKDILTSLKQIVTYKTKDGKEVSFENNDDTNTLIKKLSLLNLESLEIRYTSVEDEFIKYYEG